MRFSVLGSNRSSVQQLAAIQKQNELQELAGRQRRDSPVPHALDAAALGAGHVPTGIVRGEVAERDAQLAGVYNAGRIVALRLVVPCFMVKK
jgi:hypothetical protein